MTEAITVRKDDGLLRFASFDEALSGAQKISRSAFVPRAYQGKPVDIALCWQYGAEIGLHPMHALRAIGVINGVPSLYGDGLLSVAQRHPQWGGKKESYDEEKGVATCTVMRKGEPDATATFSVDDAKAAGLWGSKDPWKRYPRRMLQMRARGFALRDQFADALAGLVSQAEAEDYPVDVSANGPAVVDAKVVHAEQPPADTLPASDSVASEPGHVNPILAQTLETIARATTLAELDAFKGHGSMPEADRKQAIAAWRVKRSELQKQLEQAAQPVVDAEVVESEPTQKNEPKGDDFGWPAGM